MVGKHITIAATEQADSTAKHMERRYITLDKVDNN